MEAEGNWRESSEHKNGALWEGSLVHQMLGRSNHGILPHRSCRENPGGSQATVGGKSWDVRRSSCK